MPTDGRTDIINRARVHFMHIVQRKHNKDDADVGWPLPRTINEKSSNSLWWDTADEQIPSADLVLTSCNNPPVSQHKTHHDVFSSESLSNSGQEVREKYFLFIFVPPLLTAEFSHKNNTSNLETVHFSIDNACGLHHTYRLDKGFRIFSFKTWGSLKKTFVINKSVNSIWTPYFSANPAWT